MIQKIISIQNVGKFENYKCNGDVTFRRLTLVYGDNASGKTTLTAILRSLQTGEAAFIEERHRLASNGGLAEVQLLAESGPITYRDTAWSGTLPGIEIFDERFVGDNVYGGRNVEPEHRKNLHRFAIGEQGVLVARRIDEIVEALHIKGSELRGAEQAIRPHITGDMLIDDFVALPIRTDVDEAITAKKEEIEGFKEAHEIALRPQLSAVSLPEVDFSDLETLLSKTLEDVSEEAEARVKQHLEKQHMDHDSEAWINQGMKYEAEELCPFCGQSLAGLDLIAAYKAYFSQGYSALKDEIKESTDGLRGTLSESALSSIQQQIAANQTLVEFWKHYVRTNFPNISFEDTQSDWISMRDQATAHLASKAASPLSRVPVSQELSEAWSRYKKRQQEVSEYCQQVEQVNSAIVGKKAEVSSGVLAAAEAELQRLNNVKKRHEEPAATACTRYQGLATRKQQLDGEKEQARMELEQYTENLLQRFEGRINKYLSLFGADFSIVETREAQYGGTPRLEYGLLINHEQVELEARDDSLPGPSFGNTLSSGDKTTLALAFFMARIDADNALSEKVVLFDDPLSGLDSHRRSQTQQEITRVAGLAKQVVLLSNEPNFLRLMWEKAESFPLKTLCISRRGDASMIEEWDIERETRPAHQRSYDELREYLDGGTYNRSSAILHNVAGEMRPLLEGNLQNRFPGDLHRNDTLGDMIHSIRDAAETAPLACLKPILQELSNINDYSVGHHHANCPNLTDGELRPYVSRTLKAIRGVPDEN